MGPQLNEQRWFREVLALVGTDVELGLLTGGTVLTGKIMNASFDSLLLESQGKSRMVRFEDLSYLLPRTATVILPGQ